MKKLLSILFCLLVLPFTLFSFEVQAEDKFPDLNRTGSITIEFNNKYNLVGSEYAIWHVADIQLVDNVYRYVNTAEFRDVHLKWTNQDLDYWNRVDSAPVIGFVDEYVQENGIRPYQTGTIGSSNTLTFSDLPLGIYLVKQTKVGEAGYVMTTYLATIPDDKGNYDVVTYGKTDPYKPAKKPPVTGENPKTATEMMQENFLLIGGLSLIFMAVLIGVRKRAND